MGGAPHPRFTHSFNCCPMGLLSALKSQKNALGLSKEPIDAVEQERQRARQRLMGATVLVVVGVVMFPLIFETQPRSVPADVAISVARKNIAPAASAAVTHAPVPVASQPTDEVVTETREQAGKEVSRKDVVSQEVISRQASKAASATPIARGTAVALSSAALPPPAPKAVPVVAPLLAEKPSAKSSAAAIGVGKSAVAESRFIVQIGAFADPSSAQEMKRRAEKLGLKTYTQVAQTATGKHIRVRLGPFTDRDEADKAMAKVRGAGLGGVVLTL
jgi:DedD protein